MGMIFVLDRGKFFISRSQAPGGSAGRFPSDSRRRVSGMNLGIDHRWNRSVGAIPLWLPKEGLNREMISFLFLVHVFLTRGFTETAKKRKG